MSRMECFIFGALGGMCPTIASLAGYYATKPKDPMPEISVLIGLGLFAVLGSIVAMGFGAREVKAAIVAGIAAPGIVTNIASGVAGDRAKTELSAPAAIPTSMIFGITAAFAQSDDIGTGRLIDPQLYGNNPVIQVVPSIQGGVPSNLDLPVTATVSQDGAATDVLVGTISDGSARSFVLPENTTALQIGDANVPLSDPGGSVNVVIETKPTFGGDLLWALGGKRTYEVQGIEVLP